MAATPNWHKDAFFGIHYDLHANAGDDALGKELSPEHLRERLLQVKPDWIQCDCKGHPGYTSWPTSVGSTAPGVINDQLRIYRDVTAELGIKLGVHYSGVWDTRAIELHPDWARIDANGQPDPNNTCRLSDYDRELMIPQMLEIVDRYNVDGFWVDGENWASKPCWCDRCKREFTSRTGIAAIPLQAGEPGWDAWLAFHRDLFVAHVTRYADAVHARKPGCLICSNWMYTVRQPDPVAAPVDYLSGDFDPAFGANRAAVEGRLIDSRGMSWDLMAWGFAKTNRMGEDPDWVMKPALHLCQEVSEVLALGGAVMIYNQPQRTGWLTGWQQSIIAAVADFCRRRQDTCFKSQTLPQAAILHLASHYYRHNEPLFNVGKATQPVEGALHALLETHYSTDILTEDATLRSIQEYALIVVPEQTELSAQIRDTLAIYAAAGGIVVISGSHLSRDYPELVGAQPDGEQITEQTYLEVDEHAVPVSGPWQPVTPGSESEVWAYRLSQQEPAKDITTAAIVTRCKTGKGSIIAIHGPIFCDYFLGHYPLLRRFIGELLERAGVDRLVRVEASPRLELVLRRKDGKLLINLINRGAAETLNANRVILEELLPVEQVTLHVRQPGEPRSVTLVPNDAKITWMYASGQLTIALERVAIYSIIVIE